MDALIAAAASGMRSRAESLDLLANNLANSTSAGYKADSEFYGVYTSAEQEAGSGRTELPVVDRHWTDLSQGVLTGTGNPLDFGIAGQGFFAVNTPGGPLYTRNGSFRLTPGGELQTADGYAVRSKTGVPLRFDPNRPIEATPEGILRQDGRNIGQLEIVQFEPAAAVAKKGHTYFQITRPGVKPAASQAVVIQGKLEAANVNTPETAVRLVSIMRQFETLQHALNLGGDMNRHAVEEVARVTP